MPPVGQVYGESENQGAMNRFEHLLFLRSKTVPLWRGYAVDGSIGLVGASLVTAIIFVLHLYPLIHNISLLDLLIVWGLAINRGLYAALVASFIAFLSFDFFLIPPFYTLNIGQPEEWIALFFFLATAVVTGFTASKLRQSVQDANSREHESRALYVLMSATANEEDVKHQLSVVAHTIVEVFGEDGVRYCTVLLPDGGGKLAPLVSAGQAKYSLELSSDEDAMMRRVMTQGEPSELYDVSLLSGSSSAYAPRAVVHSTASAQRGRRYIHLSPLKLGQRVVGVVRLVVEESPQFAPFEPSLRIRQKTQRSSSTKFWKQLDQISESIVGIKREQSDSSQQSFFEAFLDQAASIIERGRLRDESLQVEVLRRTDALRAALLSSVSHDLRTPLSSIKAAASSLQQEDVEWDEEARHSFAATIENEADRLNRLVDNLLDMSRIEGGALKPEKELYLIEELIRDVLEHMQFTLRGREVKTVLFDNLPPVELDYLQIDQALTNLIENAVRYTPEGSPIEIGAEALDGQMRIYVADRGPGIPQQDKERIFDKFYRVMSSQRKNAMGTGLGLAVCRGLVEANGGRIWVENRAGGGAIFRLTLPVEKIKV